MEKENADRRFRWEDLVELLITCAFLWVLCHPTTFEKAKEMLRNRWKLVQHRLSIWEAIHSIRNLPE